MVVVTQLDVERNVATPTLLVTAPTVIKRDGTRTTYDLRRVRDAIRPAWMRAWDDAVDESELAAVVAAVDGEIFRRFPTDVKVYEIQAIVEQTLIETGHGDVAEIYATYRLEKDLRRKQAFSVEHQVGRLTDSEVANENANKDSRVFHVQRDRMAGSVAKARGLAMLPPRVASAHIKGQIHFHDLDYSPYTPFNNCDLPNFADMLANGFTMGNAQVESPKSIETAASQLAQLIIAVSSSQYGGVTIETIDLLLAPYAEKSYQKHLATAAKWIRDESDRDAYARDLTIKEIYDSAQTLLFNVNTTASTQGQTPFVSIGLGLGTSWLEREIQKAVFAVQEKGLGAEGRTPVFPKLIFTLKRGVNLEPTDPNYDIKQLAVRCATKRMYPDVVLYDNIVKITGSYKTAMGCRSHLSAYVNPQTGEQETVGRMNLGVVTLNLPRIALESRGDTEEFWRLLDGRLEICHEALRFREARVRQAVPENAPILYKSGGFARLEDGDNDGLGRLFDNGRATLSLGYIGLYEVATVFFGRRWETNEQAKQFTIDVLAHMKSKCDAWNAADFSGTGGKVAGASISVYSTPSESLTDRFAKMDRERFGVVPDVTDKGSGRTYYVNSFHLDPRLGEADGWGPFRKLDFEAPYAPYTSGGFIHYTEWPNVRNNPKAVEAVWDYAYDHDIGYMGVNVPIDRCFRCGYEGDFVAANEGFTCPVCGNTGRIENGDDPDSVEVIRRVCGYLSEPVARGVARGRQHELADRVNHTAGSNDYVGDAR
ncbi:anaerobic ribonucleoside-triphosphate reductase [Xylanimonas cellulosilytica DSM 15894]|uniref:Anaerobic ribonucleoside-triphosphate reductase n=1 Tax=Xylanimonas cellulosilytica (strain DSM 15894 / JCM 12276 / CECT 5975 / KCTC 9989 / LMG 20990 / NBRC 107835 / XIL07) TaxID=446471 RepID=D1BVJ9_XYLCX|nr:anaerobic ribonucleoside-triphosphate reductase [Xylanimonas cellulosilytica]ACZ31318.1 anaerobic ribonucleoside-triphosphate reductase [Xylanimonas cellulosilytica DSM 15894]